MSVPPSVLFSPFNLNFHYNFINLLAEFHNMRMWIIGVDDSYSMFFACTLKPSQ
jgi:hypothetical protein